MVSLKNLYLVTYNVLLSLSWLATLSIALSHLNSQGLEGLWERIELPLKVSQTAAIMEVFHSLFGLVRSPIATTVMQVSSRLGLLWAVCNPIQDTHVFWGFALMVVSWCLVEVPRYAFYATKIFEITPYWLLWLRYSLFIILYPTGISGELLCIWKALPLIQQSQMWSIAMPNAINFGFSFYWCVLICTALYVPGSPVLFSHMLAQRKKELNPKPKQG
eukprot:TRINITY_DN186_c0_g1_i1.p1 TRINITY_DN186_c0_g1~~TRINITY_DN186_c0_g1_i1.p1  ORF type:complete len:218 (-),score=31.74 TRINITY_DN186_c0_g1_i1:82-735(-)